MGGRQALVQLVEDGGEDGLQPRHVDLGVVVQSTEPVVTERLNHVPHVHQVNCKRSQAEAEKDAGEKTCPKQSTVRVFFFC